jgi:hypothetical protein
VDIQFTLLFFLFIAVAAFIAKRMMAQGGRSSAAEDIVEQIAPFLSDRAALRIKVARDLRGKRIDGAGRIADVRAFPETVVIVIRARVDVQTAGTAIEQDVVFDLTFIRPDEPDEAGMGRYVEFTGILADVTAPGGTPVISVEPGEILYIGDGPPGDTQPEEELPEEPAVFR